MTSPIKQNLIGLAAVMIAMMVPTGARAGVASGPRNTNAALAAENLNSQYYEAEQSFQEKLKVGRDRYAQKQVVRAKILAGMASELQARQQNVVIQPAPSLDADKDEPVSMDPSLLVALISAALFGLGFHLYKRKPILVGRLPGDKTGFVRYTVE